MSTEGPIASSTNSAKRFVPCKDCQQNIYFDPKMKSKTGRFIPLNENGSAHNCPKRQRNIAGETSAALNQQVANNNIAQECLEQVEMLVHQHEQLRTELKVGLEHVSQRLNNLQCELQKLEAQGRQ